MMAILKFVDSSLQLFKHLVMMVVP